MPKTISSETAKLTLDLLTDEIEQKRKTAGVGDLVPLFAARAELAAIVGDGLAAPTRKTRGSRKRGLPASPDTTKTEELPEA